MEVDAAPEGVVCEYCGGPHDVLLCPELEDLSALDVEVDGGATDPAA